MRESSVAECSQVTEAKWACTEGGGGGQMGVHRRRWQRPNGLAQKGVAEAKWACTGWGGRGPNGHAQNESQLVIIFWKMVRVMQLGEHVGKWLGAEPSSVTRSHHRQERLFGSNESWIIMRMIPRQRDETHLETTLRETFGLGSVP
ncbi:hypothetical protein B0H14DRAFT_2572817 [Mycena olivaceomarginata]|nr:hypothetical protein B0H14DRAFT_2572817 [Mycena olivaceomarginata]